VAILRVSAVNNPTLSTTDRNKNCLVVFFSQSVYHKHMNIVGKISLGLAAVVALHLAARAESIALPLHGAPHASARTDNSVAADPSAQTADSNPSDNPYATIVARNIFGLVPIPPPPPPPAPPVDAPPKITANGIMNVFGELEALFKVSTPAKGSTPAKDQSYMLSQGQRQDDVEVVKIDEPNGTITFDNHGTTQEIPLVPAAKDSGSGHAGAVSGPQSNGFNPGGLGRRPMPGAGFGGGFTGGGRPAGFTPGQNNPGLGNNNNNNGNPANANNGNPQIYQPPVSEYTPEQNAVLIEAEREAAYAQEQQGQKPAVPPEMFPSTPYTLPPPGSGK
jgi:hypothetical protein